MQITHSDRWLAVGLEAQFEPFSSQPAVLDRYGVAVWRGPTGLVQVWEDRCPHRGMRLSFGFVKGDRLSCMYHGWSFQPDGHCRRIPAHPDLEPPKTICAKTFAVTIFRGIVFANLVPLHSDYESLAGFGYARPILARAFSVVNIHLMRAHAALRCRCHARISVTRRLGSSILRSRHWPRRTPISISTMLSQLACLGV